MGTDVQSTRTVRPTRLASIPSLAFVGLLVVFLCSATGAGQTDPAKELRAEADVSVLSTSLALYEARSFKVPSTEQGLKALVERPRVDPIPERWRQLLEEVPKDPWGREYKYAAPGKRSKKAFDVYSAGPDGVDGNEDDIGNWKKTEAK